MFRNPSIESPKKRLCHIAKCLTLAKSDAGAKHTRGDYEMLRILRTTRPKMQVCRIVIQTTMQ